MASKRKKYLRLTIAGAVLTGVSFAVMMANLLRIYSLVGEGMLERANPEATKALEHAELISNFSIAGLYGGFIICSIGVLLYVKEKYFHSK